MDKNCLIYQQLSQEDIKPLKDFQEENKNICSLSETDYHQICFGGIWIARNIALLIEKQLEKNPRLKRENLGFYFGELHPSVIDFEEDSATQNRSLEQSDSISIRFNSGQDFCNQIKDFAVTTNKMMRNQDGDIYTSNLFLNTHRKIILTFKSKKDNDPKSENESSSTTKEADSEVVNDNLPNDSTKTNTSKESDFEKQSETQYLFKYQIVNKYDNTIDVGSWIRIKLLNRVFVFEVVAVDVDKKIITLQNNRWEDKDEDLKTLFVSINQNIEAFCYKQIDPCKYYMEILSTYIYHIFFLGLGKDNSPEIPQKIYEKVHSLAYFVRSQKDARLESLIDIKSDNDLEDFNILENFQKSLVIFCLKLSYPDAKSSFYNQANNDEGRISLIKDTFNSLVTDFIYKLNKEKNKNISPDKILNSYQSQKDLKQYKDSFSGLLDKDNFISFCKIAFDYLCIDNLSLADYQNQQTKTSDLENKLLAKEQENKKFSNDLKIQQTKTSDLENKLKTEQKIKVIGLFLGALLLGLSVATRNNKRFDPQ